MKTFFKSKGEIIYFIFVLYRYHNFMPHFVCMDICEREKGGGGGIISHRSIFYEVKNNVLFTE